MPLDQSDLPEPTYHPEGTESPTRPRIAEWVVELPPARRTSDFDDVIAEIRGQGATGKWARLETGPKAISANKVSTLKKRFPDVEFKQKGGETYATLKHTA